MTGIACCARFRPLSGITRGWVSRVHINCAETNQDVVLRCALPPLSADPFIGGLSLFSRLETFIGAPKLKKAYRKVLHPSTIQLQLIAVFRSDSIAIIKPGV